MVHVPGNAGAAGPEGERSGNVHAAANAAGRDGREARVDAILNRGRGGDTPIPQGFAELAGYDLPDDAAEDSFDFLPVLLGKQGDEPVRRDQLVQQYIRGRVESLNNRRAADLAKSGTPGPEGSLGKILWTEGMRTMTDTVSSVLGPKLIADTGEWGTFAWGEHVLGAPGYRIAGGSDEVQRNILGERVLGLPKEPRADTGPWREIQQ